MIDLRHWGASPDEINATMPGDDLIETAQEVGTRAITINAAPERIFAFLAQMGLGRAGWYSYDLLDNLGRRSATEIHPEWAVSAAGEPVPAGPLSFTAAVVEPPTSYVLDLAAPGREPGWIGFTLAYRLNPVDVRTPDTATRLVSRVRIRIDGPGGAAAARALLLGDGLMVRRQLLGLKARATAQSR